MDALYKDNPCEAWNNRACEIVILPVRNMYTVYSVCTQRVHFILVDHAQFVSQTNFKLVPRYNEALESRRY